MNDISNRSRAIRALVVEDHRDYAQVIADILSIQGCEVEVAHNALSALETAKRMRPAIIFSDLNLSGEMSGFGLARLIRQDKLLAETPLVAITGYGSEHDKMAAINAGFNMVFPKPFKFADLAKALQTYVQIDMD